MRTTIIIIFTVLFIQADGQVIDFSQRDGLLNVRHDTTFTEGGNALYNGVLKTTKGDGIELSYCKDGFRFVDSSFYLTKKLQSVSRYRNNVITARFLFDQNGNKLQEEIYLDSNNTSKQSIWWHPNGQLWRIEMYYNRQKSGKWYEWFQNGNLLFEGEFKQGHKFGIWSYYNAKTREIIRQEKY